MTLTTIVEPRPGYPARLELECRWSLGTDGLTCTLTARNAGSGPAPYGCGLHPYLRAATGSTDDWLVHLPASHRLLTDDDLVPTDLVEVAALAVATDFRTPRAVAGARLDNAHCGTAFGTDGTAAVSVTDAAGTGARIRFGTATPWVHLYTGPVGGPPAPGVAIEPTTGPPDAFRSGTGLVVLAPGEHHRAWWRIEPVGVTAG